MAPNAGINEPHKILRAMANLKGGESWRSIHLNGEHDYDCQNKAKGTD